MQNLSFLGSFYTCRMGFKEAVDHRPQSRPSPGPALVEGVAGAVPECFQVAAQLQSDCCQ